jgi:pyrroline-5-carboxylate reductase
MGFVGGGRVTRILLGGWRRAGVLPPEVRVCEPDDAAFDGLRAAAPEVRRASLGEAVYGADLVMLALHPPAMPTALQQVKLALSPASLVVSLAPRITLDALETSLGTQRLVRMIPNAPSLIGRGYNPVSFGTAVDPATRRELAPLFAALGEAPEVEEEHLEAYAVLTGMGPTYFWFQWQCLREIVGDIGLPPAATDAALRAMVDGSLATLLDSGLTPQQVVDLVPIRPLSTIEPSVAAAYRDTLPALHARIRPAATARS